MRILVVESDRLNSDALRLMLGSEKFNVSTTEYGEEACDLLKLYDYDLCTLATNLSDMSGFDVLRHVRTHKVKTPILILSALAGVEDKVRALDLGADDYLTRPFDKDELVARIHALIRRSNGRAQSVITCGDLSVNLTTRECYVSGELVHLTAKEYAMVELLALRKGMTISKEMFLDHLYGGRDEPELKTIDVFICKLRRKIGGDHYVQTVWGRGYVMRDSLPSVESPALAPVQNGGAFSDGAQLHTRLDRGFRV